MLFEWQVPKWWDQYKKENAAYLLSWLMIYQVEKYPKSSHHVSSDTQSDKTFYTLFKENYMKIR